MKAAFGPLTVVTTIILASAACTPPATPPPHADAPQESDALSPQQLHERFGVLADALLGFYGRCFSGTTFFGERFAVFEPHFHIAFPGTERDAIIAQLEAELIDPAHALDTDALDACTQVLSNASCTGDVSALAVCGGIFRGTRGVGEGCATSDECTGDRAAVICSTETSASDAPCGVCQALPREGAACRNDDVIPCAGGLVCNDGACRALPADGEACIQGLCGDGLLCAPSTLTCAPPPGDGEPCPDFVCAGDLQCDADGVCATAAEIEASLPQLGDACVDGACAMFHTGLACDAATNTCVSATAVDAGSSCTPVTVGFESTQYCKDQLAGINACIDLDGDGAFACTPIPQVGDACVQGLCAAGLLCDGNTDRCVAPPPLPREGEACPDLQCDPGTGDVFCNQDTGRCERTSAAPQLCAE